VRGKWFAKHIVPWPKTDFEERAAWARASLSAAVVRGNEGMFYVLEGSRDVSVAGKW